MAKENQFKSVLEKFSAKKTLPCFTVQPAAYNDVIGGFHLGDLYALWAEAGAGKSSIAFQVCRSLLKQGLSGIYVDVEKAFNESQQESFKLKEFVDSGQFVVLTCENMLQLEEIIVSLPNSGISFIVIDSLTMVRPYTPDDLMITDIRPGIHALQESTVLGKLKDICYSYEIGALVLNHARANIKITGPINRYAPDKKMAGGFAVQHIPSVVSQIEINSKVKNIDDEVIGCDITIQSTKCKWVPPYHPIRETLIYGKGIDPKLSLIKKAIDLGIITKVGRTYYVPTIPDKKFNSRTIWELTSEQCRELKTYLDSNTSSD